ncbi:MAG: hypothetical protein GY822_09795 [Deltaproteobacteria bacterium]|nr:hypothetical protein [Deltaproteobacteria bacterium]
MSRLQCMNAAQQIPVRIFDSSRDLLEETIGLLTSGKAKKMKEARRT